MVEIQSFNTRAHLSRAPFGTCLRVGIGVWRTVASGGSMQS